MEEKILKSLNKKFDKTWERLSFTEKKESVKFMLEVLEQSDKFYKETLAELYKAKDSLKEFVDDDVKNSLLIMKDLLNKLTRKKIAKEDKLQEEIVSSNNRQLLFSDIYVTYKKFDKAVENVTGILGKTNNVINNGTEILTVNKLATLVLQVETMTELHERYINVFSNQAKKVNELFAEYIKTKENDFTL